MSDSDTPASRDGEKRRMALKWILLYNIPDEIMLLVEHPSGVVYRNQVGGNVCWQAELEGMLSPFDVDPEIQQRIQVVRVYRAARAMT